MADPISGGTRVWERELLEVRVALRASAERVRPETIDHTADLIGRHRTLEPRAGQSLQVFAFRGAGLVQGVVDALAISAYLYHIAQRRLPDNVPLRFVRAGWRHCVIRDGVVDRGAMNSARNFSFLTGCGSAIFWRRAAGSMLISTAISFHLLLWRHCAKSGRIYSHTKPTSLLI